MAGSLGEIIGAIVPFILLSYSLRTGRKWYPAHTPARGEVHEAGMCLSPQCISSPGQGGGGGETGSVQRASESGGREGEAAKTKTETHLFCHLW